MQLNNNKERRAYWDLVMNKFTTAQIEDALNSLPKETARVIRWHYLHKYSFQDICNMMQRSISIIRNHHNRGIFKLAQYFGDEQPL